MEHNDYPRTVLGIGYAITRGSRAANPKAYEKWYGLLKRFMDDRTGFSTIDLHSSWECFENFLAWYDKRRANMGQSGHLYLVVQQSEYVPKLIRVSGKKQEILCTKFGPKTAKLTTTKPPTYRHPYWAEVMRYDKDTGTFKKGRSFRKGCKAAQRGRVKLPKGCALYERKVKAAETYREHVYGVDARSEERREAAATCRAKQNVRDVKKFADKKYYRDVLAPALAKRAQDLECAEYDENKRMEDTKGLEARRLQKGTYRRMGYIGEGSIPTSIRGKQTRAYYRWVWLLKQCYGRVDDSWYEGKKPYTGYRMSKHFLCFQNFAKWFEKYDWDHAVKTPMLSFGPNSKGALILGRKNTKVLTKGESC